MTATHARHALAFVLAACGMGCALSAEGADPAPAGSSSSAAGSSVSSTGAGGDGAGGDGVGGAASSSSSAASNGGAGATGGAQGSGGRTGDCEAPDVFDASSGRCYRFFTEATEYEDVQAECENWHPNGTFAAVSTKGEYDFLAEEFSSETDFWVGGDDLDNDGNWQWHNGETWGQPNGWGQPGSEPWKTDEPMGGAGERCLRMKEWLFESKNCDAQPFLCERL